MNDIQAVLFDLDGTLVDTAPDMANALNTLLQRHGHPGLSNEIVRPYVSHGATALVKLGFGLTEKDPDFADLRQQFLDIYAADLDRYSRTFPGMEEVLQHLEQQPLPWGIVTNKPGYLTEPLLDKLGLRKRSACVVSGDTTARRKPHPDPLLHACEVLKQSPKRVVYIGDAERDIKAGNSAGMPTLVATFGYLSEQDQPDTWGASGLVAHPLDILKWMNGHA